MDGEKRRVRELVKQKRSIDKERPMVPIRSDSIASKRLSQYNLKSVRRRSTADEGDEQGEVGTSQNSGSKDELMDKRSEQQMKKEVQELPLQ